ncbi:glutaredoxin family protein [Undibacterium pigrum]|uniref:Glutaredoxin n=1 Tax=Undibacterium pigrum TaxID=401470 RepID=A0A318IXU4_9BURK|nr:glutaredoxin family protein [Undibacterium pigrum]PXX39793.1 glutaredoxin [Undibacterium pigrum]
MKDGKMLKQRMKSIASYVLILAAGLAVGLAAANVPRWLTPAYIEGDYSRYFPDAKTKVVLYATATCPYCAKTQEYLKAKNIAYVKMDINESEKARQEFKQLKGEMVPMILVGNRQIRGFNPEVLDSALEKIH